MKAPDKIYLGPCGVWDTKHIPDLKDSIYIHKDALVEWARDNRDSAGKISYTELIEKIERI